MVGYTSDTHNGIRPGSLTTWCLTHTTPAGRNVSLPAERSQMGLSRESSGVRARNEQALPTNSTALNSGRRAANFQATSSASIKLLMRSTGRLLRCWELMLRVEFLHRGSADAFDDNFRRRTVRPGDFLANVVAVLLRLDAVQQEKSTACRNIPRAAGA